MKEVRKNNYLKSKRYQMEISFGMIFSIILIIVFIGFAFYVIQKFLVSSDSVKVGRFKDNLQSDIDKMWKSSQGNLEKEYSLPSKIEFFCFVDYSSESRGRKKEIYEDLKYNYYENENLFFYPASAEELGAIEIKNIDIEKTTQTENPLCFENGMKIIIKKEFESSLVVIER